MADFPAYGRQSHISAVLRASSARLSARSVLETLCRRSDFKSPYVTITREQISADTRLTLQTVKRALAALRAEGSIDYKAGKQGGRSIPVTWRLCIAPAGAHLARDPVANDAAAPAEAARPQEGLWVDLAGRFASVDPGGFKAWVSKLKFDRIEGGVLHVVAPSEFAASYCRMHLAANLLTIAEAVAPDVRRIEVRAAA